MIKKTCATKYALSIAATFLCAHVGAATLTFNGDLISGVSGVQAFGTTWNVTFNDGSANDVFGTNPPFSNVNDSLTASNALMTELEILAPAPPTNGFVGCSSATGCYLISPYQINSTSVTGYAVLQDALGAYSLASIVGTPSSTYGTRSYVTWENAVVPIPAAIWLFGSGLLGLIGLSRRKQTA